MPIPTSCSACCSISRATPCRRSRAAPPSDPGRDQIRITGRREGAVVVIEVSDTGPGISEQARAHLFEAFQGSTRTGGSGLGLAIAAELVRAHGGEIRLVDGTIGATFRLTIPDRAVELQARAASGRGREAGYPPAHLPLRPRPYSYAPVPGRFRPGTFSAPCAKRP